MLLEGLDWQLVEKLGGWAAVLVIVRWLMTRFDRTIEHFEESVKGFQKFQAEASLQLEKIADRLDALAERIDGRERVKTPSGGGE